MVLAVAAVAAARAAPALHTPGRARDRRRGNGGREATSGRASRSGRRNTPSPSKPYKTTIPNTTVSYAMAPIPAGEFMMGSAGAEAKPDEKPQHKVKLDAFWMQAHEVTWDAYLMFMFVDQANERAKPDPLVDGLSRPTSPYVEMSFGRGHGGFPTISMTQHAANKFAQWLSARTGEFYRLPTEAEWEYACRAGTAIGVAAGNWMTWPGSRRTRRCPHFPAGHITRWGRRNQTPGGSTTCSATSWSGRSTSTRRTRLRRRRTLGRNRPCRIPMPSAAARGTSPETRGCTIRVPSDASWKKQDPQLPKSIWYMTDAQWLGFRLVRPATLPTVEEMYRAWNNGVEQDPF